NPLHLYLGSQQDNMDDMVRDGRSCAGIASGMAALSTKDATEVLRLVGGDKSYAAIARRLGVSHSVVSSIAHGKTYKDIPGERREPRQPANRFFGVSKNGNKWLVRLRLDGKIKTLGWFGHELLAACCVNAHIAYLGLDKPLNVIDPDEWENCG